MCMVDVNGRTSTVFPSVCGLWCVVSEAIFALFYPLLNALSLAVKLGLFVRHHPLTLGR